MLMFFQYDTWLLGYLSTHHHVTFYMEPFCHCRCIRNNSRGNSWVFLTSQNEDLPNLFSIFTLYIYRFQLHHENVMPVLLMIFAGIFAFTLVFLTCELSQRLGNAFDEIDFTVHQFDWYLFPIQMKRMFPVIIVIVQQPISMECFGSIKCTRDTFKNVIHCAVSYYMMLRQLSN